MKISAMKYQRAMGMMFYLPFVFVVVSSRTAEREMLIVYRAPISTEKCEEQEKHLTGDDWLLVSAPKVAYLRRNNLVSPGTAITGHTGRCVGWNRDPVTMTKFAKMVAANALRVIETRSGVSMLHVAPRGVFFDLVVLAHILDKKPRARIGLRYILSSCATDQEPQACENRVLREWVQSRYPKATFSLYYHRPMCLNNCGNCPRLCRFYEDGSNKTNLNDCDIVYGCSGDSRSGFGTIQKVINVGRKDVVGIVCGVNAQGILLGATNNVVLEDAEKEPFARHDDEQPGASKE